MMSITETDFQSTLPAELERLQRTHGSGLTVAQLSKKRERLKDLYTAPLVFQPRLEKEAPWAKASHVRSLTKSARQRGDEGLAPILLLAVAGVRLIVDGHCRLKAYWKVDPTGSREVPVIYLKDTSVRDALFTSSANNSRDKLPLSRSEKAERAWFLVRSEEGRPDARSLRDIEDATGCSRSSVHAMRKLLGRHPRPTEANPDAYNPRERTWADAKLGERSQEELDFGTWREKWITKVASQLRKALGDRPDKQPELFHEALRRAYPCIAKDIDEEYASAREEAEAATEGETSDF